jgi:hypothetical protein
MVLDVRALHALLGDAERVFALLYGSLWLWALANLSNDYALFALRGAAAAAGEPGGGEHAVWLSTRDAAATVLRLDKARPRRGASRA